jgi:hypothetical protein
MSLNSQIPFRAAAVTPSDSTEIFGHALYVGVGGNVAILTEGGDTVTFTGVPAGTTIVQRFTKVLATGTTASAIVRQWAS